MTAASGVRRRLAWLAALVCGSTGVSQAQFELPAAAAVDPVGSVQRAQLVGNTAGGMEGLVAPGDGFGYGIADLGDLDGDGVRDVALGAQRIRDANNDLKGGVWICFMNADGTVRTPVLISEGLGGFTGNLGDDPLFGAALEPLGDLDGDGVVDLAVGAPFDKVSGQPSSQSSFGGVWILFLNPDGTVKDQQHIGLGLGGFTGQIEYLDLFGISLAALGDLDGDGLTELAVGVRGDDDPSPPGVLSTDRGGVWILFLAADGSVKSHQKISSTSGQLVGPLDNGDGFGAGLAALGDLNEDGVPDLAVGAPFDEPLGFAFNLGAVWILFLDEHGEVTAEQKITTGVGGFTGPLVGREFFGTSLAPLGDIDGDGVVDLAVGADDGFGVADSGSVWVLRLARDGTVQGELELGKQSGGMQGLLSNGDNFGGSLGELGDLDGDGVMDLFAGARNLEVGGAGFVLSLAGARTANWTNLHQGLAGAAGKPVLVGEGTLALGDPLTLTARGVVPGSVGALLVGFSALDLPFAGGTLVPDFSPPGFALRLATGQGTVTFGTTYSARLPAGVELYAQLWVLDPTGPFGFSATNAVLGTPP